MTYQSGLENERHAKILSIGFSFPYWTQRRHAKQNGKISPKIKVVDFPRRVASKNSTLFNRSISIDNSQEATRRFSVLPNKVLKAHLLVVHIGKKTNTLNKEKTIHI